MSESVGEIEFEGIDELLDRFVEVWDADGYKRDTDSPVGWETWKWEYREHLQTAFFDDHDPTALTAADIDSLIEAFDETVGLSDRTPVYMLGGGANGGIAWRDFKEISRDDPSTTAEMLSFLFDPEEDLVDRLEAFREHYSEIDTSPGSLLALGACLLTFVHPDRYVHYKWTPSVFS